MVKGKSFQELCLIFELFKIVNIILRIFEKYTHLQELFVQLIDLEKNQVYWLYA